MYIAAAISAENGVESLIFATKSFDAKMFSRILINIKKNGPKFVLFGDSLRIHTGSVMTYKLQNLDSEFIESIPYLPHLNPIERFFGALKCRYGSLRYQELREGKKVIIRKLVSKAAKQITEENVANIAKLGLKQWAQVDLQDALSQTSDGLLELQLIQPGLRDACTKIAINKMTFNINNGEADGAFNNDQAIQVLKERFGGKDNLYDWLANKRKYDLQLSQI